MLLLLLLLLLYRCPVGFEGRWSRFLSVKVLRTNIPVVHLSLGRGRSAFQPGGGWRWSRDVARGARNRGLGPMASARRQAGNACLGAHTEAALTLAPRQRPPIWVRRLMLGSVVHAGSSFNRRLVVRGDRTREMLGRVCVLALRRGRGRVRVNGL